MHGGQALTCWGEDGTYHGVLEALDPLVGVDGGVIGQLDVAASRVAEVAAEVRHSCATHLPSNQTKAKLRFLTSSLIWDTVMQYMKSGHHQDTSDLTPLIRDTVMQYLKSGHLL